MRQYILTYRFNSDNIERYNEIRNTVLEICKRHAGKHDESTSTVIFPAQALLSIKSEIIKLYNGNKSIIADDCICIYYRKWISMFFSFKSFVCTLRFDRSKDKNGCRALWKTYLLSYYYKKILKSSV